MRPAVDAVRLGPNVCQFPATAGALRDIRGFVLEMAEAAGLAGEDLSRVLLVVNEAASNAVEHSGSDVVRILWADGPQGVQVVVEDDGVFDIRGSGSDARGRGLRIALGLAEEVRVRAGRLDAPGTKVQLRITVRTGAEPDPAPAGRPRLLVVDGDRFSGRSLASLLEAEGYDVILTASVPAGRGALTRRPHLVIVDLVSAGAHADALCAAIKARSTIPVIAMSVLAPRTPPHGADRFVRKPAHPLEVLMVIRQLLAVPVTAETCRG